jgi:hypothetical protein
VEQVAKGGGEVPTAAVPGHGGAVSADDQGEVTVGILDLPTSGCHLSQLLTGLDLVA